MTGVIGWGSRDWIGEVEGWIGEVVGQRCRLVHRETRPWSTLWTVSTGAETLWFKANCPAQRSEAGVHAALARLVPDYVDAPVAVEPARGWLLTREGGTPLNHCSPNGSGDMGLATLTAVVRDYAALQRGTVSCGEQLVSAGLRVAHPVDAAELAASQAEQLAMLRAGDPRRLTADERDSVLASLPALEKAGRVLTGGAVPLAFDQSDLFPRNVFSRRLGGPYRFFDFADAVGAHPFGSLLMLVAGCLRWWRISATVGVVDCRDARVRALVDAYLGCWIDMDGAHLTNPNGLLAASGSWTNETCCGFSPGGVAGPCRRFRCRVAGTRQCGWCERSMVGDMWPSSSTRRSGQDFDRDSG